MSQVIISLDQGTTSSRALAFSEKGDLLCLKQKEIRQLLPHDGWVEQDPMEILTTQKKCLFEVIRELNLKAQDVACIGIANQRETTIVWDAINGRPIYNAIVWQDRRTVQKCERLRQDGLESFVRERTGLRIDPYFSATKVNWILDHISHARHLAEKGRLLFGTVDTWLLWNLTDQEHLSDMSNASRTLLFDIHSTRWSEELLDVFDIPEKMLPTLVESSGHLAYTKKSLLGEKILISGVAGDQQAATFGQACFHSGMTKNTYGTGGFLLMNTKKEKSVSNNSLLTTIGWNVDGDINYALEGTVFVAGSVVQWIRDNLNFIDSSEDIENLALQEKGSGGVVLVPAFVGLGAPHWDPRARGIIAGITHSTNKAHLARAALESIAFQTNDVLGFMQKDISIKLKELRVDGGAAKNNLLMQFQADISNVPVIRPVVTETTGLGAAYMAGLGAKIWADTKEIETLWKADRIFEPSMSEDKRLSLVENWNRAVARSKGWEQS